jgi:hypothetical protein
MYACAYAHATQSTRLTDPENAVNHGFCCDDCTTSSLRTVRKRTSVMEARLVIQNRLVDSIIVCIKPPHSCTHLDFRHPTG